MTETFTRTNVRMLKTAQRTLFLTFAALLMMASSALASHFRFGLITATRLSETSTTVTYRLNVALSWRLTTAPTVNGFSITGPAGNPSSVTVSMSNVTDPSGGWTNSTGTANVTLVKSSTPTRITFTSCCKISTISNNHDANWDVYTILNTNAPGSTPVSSMPAIINMPSGAPAATFTIPASDPDPGSTLTFGIPNLTSGNLAGETEPAGFSVNSSTGVVTLNTVGKTAGQQYNAMVTVTDNNNNQIMLDFLINIVGPSNPPVWDYTVTPANGSTFNVMVGTTLTFGLKASDMDAGSTVSLSASGLTSYITTANFSPAFPATGNPSTTTFSYTPAGAQLGTSTVLNFIATDNVGVQTTTSVTIKVVSEPAPSFISPTPGQNSVRAILTGVLQQDTIRAQSTLGSPVSIAFATAPSGVTYSPGIPTAGTNPGETIWSWTPTAADFGVRNFAYTATIAATPTIFAVRNYQLIVNTLPVFTSTPVTTASACALYSYTVTASDANTPYGDTVTFHSTDLPSWLTLTNVSPGVAVISGTPSNSLAGTYHFHVAAEDLFGHSYDEVEQHISLTVSADATNPSVTAPSNITVNAPSGTCAANVSIGTATASDNCGIASLVNDHASSVYNVGVTVVTWTATDVNGNTATASQTITVVDNQDPVIAVSNVSVNNDAGNCGAMVALSATASDNCGVTASPTNDWTGGAFPVGTTTVNWSVTDINGNTGTAVQTVTVTDSENPTITVSNVSVNNDAGNCSAVVALSATASDNCAGAGTPTNDWTGGAFPVGTTTVNWTVTDAHGNSATAVQTVTVADAEAPTATCQNATVYLSDVPSGSSASISVADINNGSTDNCGLGGMSLSATTYSCSDIGSNPVTLTVTDVHSNSSTCAATVTVVDNRAPHALCRNRSFSLTNLSAGSGSWVITAADIDNGSWDNCSLGTLSLSNTFFDCSNIGPNTVTLTVPDANGNVSTCTATVTIVDNEAPHAYCQNKTVYLSDVSSGTGSASISVSDIDNGSWDNCTLGTMTLSSSSFNCARIGANTVTLTVPDMWGNVASCTATVTVVDNSAPHAICTNYTLNLSGGSGVVTAADVDNGSWDNCGISSMSVYPNTFNCSNAGSNTVTLTVTDASGNSSTCNATVTVQYQPTCSISVTPANTTFTGGIPTNIYLGYGPQSATVTMNATGGSGFTYSWSPSTRLSSTTAQAPVFTPTVAGTYTYTCTATNSNGCSTTCTVSFCVVDAVDHSARGGSKVILCHIPPGNPGNPQQLSISESAVPAHLTGHTGDHLGPCWGGCGTGPKFGNEPVAEEHSHEIKVYPNPTEGMINVEIPDVYTSADITIMDVTGRVISQRVIAENKGEVNQFDLGSVAKGVYMVKISAGDDANIIKVIVR